MFQTDFAYLIIYERDHHLIDDLTLTIRVTSLGNQQNRRFNNSSQFNRSNSEDAAQEKLFIQQADEAYLLSYLEEERRKEL